jgi:hypothetical protein
VIKWLIQSRRPIKEEGVVLDEAVVEEVEEEVTEKDLLIVVDVEEAEEEEVEEEVVGVKMMRELGFQSQSWVVSLRRS